MFKHMLNEDTDLRLLEPRHAAECYALIDANRARLQNWLDWVERTRSVDDTKAYCKLALEQCSQGKSLVVGIWHRGRFAGTVGLEDINTFSGSAEIGYWLGEEFEGHGLVTNTCRAIVAHAFGTLGLNRLQIRVQPTNARSRAIPPRLGFRHEGTLRQVGRILDSRIDLDVYSLLREEWDGAPETIAFTYPLTEDAELRLLMPHYAEETFALVDNNREHLHWMTWVNSTQSVEDISNFIRYALKSMAEERQYHWSIWYRGQRAGGIGTAGSINWTSRKVEIGYWLGEAFQGKGLMTSAVRTMRSFLFETLELNRIEIRCDIRNTRSRAVIERVGGNYEGTQRRAHRIGEEIVDLHQFALLREEWEAQRKINERNTDGYTAPASPG